MSEFAGGHSVQDGFNNEVMDIDFVLTELSVQWENVPCIVIDRSADRNTDLLLKLLGADTSSNGFEHDETGYCVDIRLVVRDNAYV